MKVSIDEKDKSVEYILNKVFKDTEFTYNIVNNKVTIIKRPLKQIEITGKVTDTFGNVIAGVTVSLKGTNLGTSTNSKGEYKLKIPSNGQSLVFSFIGKETVEVRLMGKSTINVELKDNVSKIDEVVVTGYSQIKKSSFTGNSTRVTTEDISKVSARNLIDVLQVYDPSLRIVNNNEMGSDPNNLPEFVIRGRSGIGVKELDVTDISRNKLRNNPNLPIFILDGFEVSVEKIYDYDPNRIEKIEILKDAAATAVYGSRAANGVIIVETKVPSSTQLQISYNVTSSFTFPDLSSYNMMNASEKLQAELLAGLYDPSGVRPGQQQNETAKYWATYKQLYKMEYARKLNNVNQGVDTDWLSQSVRTEANLKHSLSITGGSENIRFGIDLKADEQGGVMKGSKRGRFGLGLYLDYRYKKLHMRNQISFDNVKSTDTPYGKFSDYVKVLPYNRPFNELGQAVPLEVWHSGNADLFVNPLYEATLSNFSKTKYDDLINNFSINWFIAEGLTLKGSFAINKKNDSSRKFIDPESSTFSNLDWTDKYRGTLTEGVGNSLTWNVNALVYFNRNFGKQNINASYGLEASHAKDRFVTTTYKGFPSGKLNSSNYAADVSSKPSASDNYTRRVGMFLTVNYSYNNIYLLDISGRIDGSSQFGLDKKFAPFWSTGAGINIGNYDFVKSLELFNVLKLRGSYGQTGKVNFPPYAAQDTYKNLTDGWYSTGFGTVLYYMGNTSLAWEKTSTIDLGLEFGLFNGAINGNISYYNATTKDLINSVTIPTSSGFTTYQDNIGRIRNEGWEANIKIELYKRKDWYVFTFANMNSNKGTILAISNSLEEYNKKVEEQYKNYSTTSARPSMSKPLMKYVEGGSLTSIFGMESLGINPANGKEVYRKIDGTVTYDWEASQQKIIGNSEPTARGSFGLNVQWKQLSLYSTFMYEFGGDAYNSTLVNNVENADLYNYNADRRVMTDRWQKPGDLTPLKSLRDRYLTTRPTSRFIQKNNYVKFNSMSLGYDFKSEFLAKFKLSQLRLQFTANDLAQFSTIKREMGTSYPFSRTFYFTLNLSF